MRVLSLVNHKGGCGKTTSAIHLAGALAARGSRVLLVDLDPQAHATLGLSCDAEQSPSTYELLTGRCSVRECRVRVAGGVSIVPSHARLAEFEELAAQRLHGERALRAVLEPVAGEFDIALIDCPPRADGVLTANALFAATVVVLVVETGAFALQGAVRALRLVRDGASARGTDFDVRVLATLFDRRLRIARELLVAVQARFGREMFATSVRTSARLREAAAVGQMIQQLAPRSTAAQDFAALAEEVAALVPIRGRELLPIAAYDPHGGSGPRLETGRPRRTPIG